MSRKTLAPASKAEEGAKGLLLCLLPAWVPVCAHACGHMCVHMYAGELSTVYTCAHRVPVCTHLCRRAQHCVHTCAYMFVHLTWQCSGELWEPWRTQPSPRIPVGHGHMSSVDTAGTWAWGGLGRPLGPHPLHCPPACSVAVGGPVWGQQHKQSQGGGSQLGLSQDQAALGGHACVPRPRVAPRSALRRSGKAVFPECGFRSSCPAIKSPWETQTEAARPCG